eukprot:SAG31_NODE_39065_length_291_cov_0.807292_1_plen_34_part_10
MCSREAREGEEVVASKSGGSRTPAKIERIERRGP